MAPEVMIWSDYLCPWCYLGQARATRLVDEHGAVVTWMPYELHPDVPRGGRSLRAVYGRGDDKAARRSLDRFRVLAAEEQMPFAPPERVLPTRLAHSAAIAVRRISPEAFDRFHASLFDAIWLHDVDIEDHTVLVEIAIAAGADASRTSAALADLALGDGDAAGIAASVQAARDEGITGTPGFLFNQAFAVVGLQPVEFFDRVATRLGSN